MRQPDKRARKALNDINSDAVTIVTIPDTNRKIRMRYIKPYTLERLTEVWAEYETTAPTEDAPQTLKMACKHPYFPFMEASLYSLNSYWKIRLFARLRAWIWSQIYSVDQMNAIIVEGKKKLLMTLPWYYESMALTLDTRMDWMKMTMREAEQYRAELLSVAGQHLSKNILGQEQADALSLD